MAIFDRALFDAAWFEVERVDPAVILTPTARLPASWPAPLLIGAAWPFAQVAGSYPAPATVAASWP